jgi:hypothetical protein
MKVSDAIKNQFIIFSLVAFLIYFALNSLFPITATSNILYISILNIINAIGGLFLITGLYDVVLKDKFQKETTVNFVKTLLLENNYLKNFNLEEIENMMLKLENKVICSDKNEHYKKKIINLIHDKILPMGSGTSGSDELNTFFEYYNEEIIYSTSINKDFLECKVITDYKLINNSNDKISQTIFTKKMLNRKVFEYRDVPLEVKSLELTIDGKVIDDYKDSTSLKDIFKVESDVGGAISITNEDNTVMQIQEKTSDGSTAIEFKREFKESIVVKKELKIVIPYDDVTYGHTFHRPMLNYSIRFTDENAKKVIGVLRSAFHKKTDDTITITNPQDNTVVIKLNDDLLLPKEGITIVTIR